MQKGNTQFTSLSVDAITEITEWTPVPNIAYLWMCGDKQLNRKLGVGGGVKRWFCNNRQTQISSWPTMVTHLSMLTSFRLITSLSPSWIGELGAAELSLLPSTLIEIEIVHVRAESCWLQSGLKASSPEDKKNWKIHFPTLKRLKLVGNSAWDDETIKTSLPDSLEYLSLKHNTGIRSLRNLPPNLTYLNLPLFSSFAWHDEDSRRLPRSLTAFKTGAVFLHTSIQHLPPNIINLRYSSHFKDGTSHKSVNALSQNLLKLRLAPCQVPWDQTLFKQLPSQLVSLRIRLSKKTIITSIAGLPETLEHLAFAGPFILESEALDQLPPSLKTLDVRIKSVSEENIATLPRTLTSLRLEPARLFTAKYFGLLPPMLESLYIDDCKSTAEEPEDNFGLLPRTLKSLHLGRCDTQLLKFELLPPTLSYLNLMDQNLNDSNFVSLPSSLKTVFFKSIPPLSTKGVLSLPRSVTSLTITDTENSISPSDFHLLPPNLYILDAKCSIEDPCLLQSLPRSISVLILSIHLKPVGFPYLPPNLWYISCGNNTDLYWQWRNSSARVKRSEQ